MKVKFWSGKQEVVLDLEGLSKEEIKEEFFGWLVQVADAGWEVLDEDLGEEDPSLSGRGFESLHTRVNKNS